MARRRRRRRRRAKLLSTFSFFLIVVVVFCTLVTLVLRLGLFWHWPIAYLAAVNLSMFVLYGYDKLVSGRGYPRVPERTLHLVALVGGSPAAFLGQQTFRHKTRKESFRIVFWILVTLQVALIVWAVWYYS